MVNKLEPLGQILKRKFSLSADRLEEALRIQQEKGGRLGEILIRIKAAKEEEVIEDMGAESLDRVASELEEPEDLLEATDEAPIIRLVNSVLFEAVKDRASDIHFEPYEKELVVRYRIDGLLYNILTPPKRFQNS